jgi:hypothetical protein
MKHLRANGRKITPGTVDAFKDTRIEVPMPHEEIPTWKSHADT